jgi:mediator of RNA polymerase II transcription subunit 12
MQLVHSDQEMEAFIQKYLTVIDFTSSRSETTPSPAVLAALVERFKGIGEAMSRTSEASAEPLGLSPTMCRLWLNALLRLSLVDGSSSLGKSPHQHQAALLWSLRSLLTHPAFEAYPSISEFIFDVAAILSDSIADDVRNHLMRLNSSRPTMDSRCGFLFGMMPEHDGWLALARPVIAPPAPITPAVSSPHSQSSQNSAGYFQQHQGQGQGASPGAPFLQRSHSQQNLQAQAQNQNRMYPQYPQHPQHPQHSQQNRMLAQLQRMSSSNGQLSQLQQMQQMQQRSAQPSPATMQRQPAPPPQNGGPNKARAQKPEEQEMKTVPFALQRWEVLPESSGNAAGNETAISLTLFGARKV